MIPFGDVEISLEEYELSYFGSDIDMSIARKKNKGKKETKQKLNVRFNPSVDRKCSHLADYLSKDKSKIAQAAIAIGIKQIQDWIENDKTKEKMQSKGLVEISKLKHDLMK